MDDQGVRAAQGMLDANLKNSAEVVNARSRIEQSRMMLARFVTCMPAALWCTRTVHTHCA